MILFALNLTLSKENKFFSLVFYYLPKMESEKADNLKAVNKVIDEVWENNFSSEKPSTMLLLYQNRWYAVVEDSSTIYFVASKDGQILAVARSKAPRYEKYGIPIYYVADSLNSLIAPLKVVSCSSIKNKKQNFVIQKIVPYL